MEPQDYAGGAGGVEANIDLYDSEIVEIRRVLKAIQTNVGKRRNLETFRQEVINRFGEIGFTVEVRMYEAVRETDPEVGFVHPTITITGRIEQEEEYDHARQGHEVRADVLGTGQVDTDDRETKVSMAGTGGSAFHRRKSGLFVPGK